MTSDLLLDDLRDLLARAARVRAPFRGYLLAEARLRVAAAVRRGTLAPDEARALCAGLLTIEHQGAAAA